MPRRHSYPAAERFLLSREFFGMKLGLDNITEFLDSIGRPQDNYRTIHIAGTNGKGSTAAMLSSILTAQGYKTGLFTSPHLVSFRERVRVNGRDIPKRSVAAFVDRHRKEITRRKLSFFEVCTALALEQFSRTGVEIAVIETGLGGRLDATNVLKPVLTMTTEISRDHTEILGKRLDKIAWEKAGIIKPGVPHLVGDLAPVALKRIEQVCRDRGAPLHRLSRSYVEPTDDRTALSFRYNGFGIRNARLALLGEHQLANASLALHAVAILRETGITISQRAVRQGLATVRWPGRFEAIVRRGQPTLILDVGHNATGVAAFVKTFKARYPGRSAHVLTGLVRKKEHQKMVDSLAKIATDFSLVPLETHRSSDVDELMTAVDWHDIPVQAYRSLKAGYTHLAKTTPADDIICIVGSHYLVGEFVRRFVTT